MGNVHRFWPRSVEIRAAGVQGMKDVFIIRMRAFREKLQSMPASQAESWQQSCVVVIQPGNLEEKGG